jgi:hypothetical protein
MHQRSSDFCVQDRSTYGRATIFLDRQRAETSFHLNRMSSSRRKHALAARVLFG